MAKLFFGADYGTLSARADDDDYRTKDEIEITAEQATAMAAWRIGTAISNLYEALQEISSNLPGRK